MAYNPSALRDSPRSLSAESLDPVSPERQEAAAMSKSKTISLAVVLALGLAVCAPPSALGNRVLYEPAPSAGATQPATAPADADSADDPQQPKHKENGFAHALAAPFRALAKLFGGGRKSKSEEAKQRTPQPAPSAADKNAAQVKSDANPTAASHRP